jgi:diguanylate cyclase (GGDEF)-like protein
VGGHARPPRRHRAQPHAGSDALGAGGAILFIDLDRFKEVDDRGGHALGDQLLLRIATRLREHVERVTPDAIVGRLGGDEFAVVLPRMDPGAATSSASSWSRTHRRGHGGPADGAGLQEHRAGDG